MLKAIDHFLLDQIFQPIVDRKERVESPSDLSISLVVGMCVVILTPAFGPETLSGTQWMIVGILSVIGLLLLRVMWRFREVRGFLNEPNTIRFTMFKTRVAVGFLAILQMFLSTFLVATVDGYPVLFSVCITIYAFLVLASVYFISCSPPQILRQQSR